MPAPRPSPVDDLDWRPERARAFAERILDLYTDYLASLAEGPASPRVTPASVRAAVALDVPEEPLGDDAIVAHLQTVLDHSLRHGSGAFLAYISGAGTVPGAIADLLASGLNANSGGWVLSPAATEIELQLVRWLADRFGLPPDAGGMLVSGGSLANLTALKMARDRALPGVRVAGTAGGPALALYASAESHFSVGRAADVLGLGEGSVREVPVGDELQMRVDALEELVASDVASGVVPAAIVATAGTTGTGAIDPLDEVADVAERHGAWFHVDAAYGGAIALSQRLRGHLRGIERADSITFDAHKWLYAPTVSAFTLVRDREYLSRSFSAQAAYVAQERDVADRGADLGFEGLQLSRGFIALRVWVGLLAHGTAAYARRIEHDIALTEWFGALISDTPEVELVCAPSLSICCFRYHPNGVEDEDYLNRLNARIVTELQMDGTVFPSNASVRGRAAIRSCIVTYRAEAVHLERLLELALATGARLHAGAVVA